MWFLISKSRNCEFNGLFSTLTTKSQFLFLVLFTNIFFSNLSFKSYLQDSHKTQIYFITKYLTSNFYYLDTKFIFSPKIDFQIFLFRNEYFNTHKYFIYIKLTTLNSTSYSNTLIWFFPLLVILFTKHLHMINNTFCIII